MSPRIQKINLFAQILFAIVLAHFFARLFYYHYEIVRYPYPLEYREGAMTLTSAALLKGLNPFDLKNQPQYTNVYGILYYFVVYPFAKMFGPTVLVHRVVSAFFLFASGAVLFLVMRRQKIPLLFNLSGLLMFYAVLLFPGTTTPCSGPNTMGVFLFLLTIFIPWFFDFSWRSLVASSILGIVAFYTKPYFVLAIPYVAAYAFLFVSKKKSILYGLLSALMFAATIIPVKNCFPCYFNNNIFIHTNATFNEDKFFFEQFRFVMDQHRPLVWILLLSGAWWIFTDGVEWFKKKGKMAGLRLKQLLDLNQPLFPKSISYNFFCFVCSFLVLYFRLGKNRGAWMWYFFQLLSPFLILWTIETLKGDKKWGLRLLVMPLVVFNLYYITLRHDFAEHFKKLGADLAGWQMIEGQITRHKNILNSPIIATLLIEQGKPVYDNGLSEYFKMGAYRYKYAKLFPPDGLVLLRSYEFRSEIRTMLANKDFDLIILTKNYAPLVPAELTQYYQYLGDVKLPLPHSIMSFTVTLWQPK